MSSLTIGISGMPDGGSYNADPMGDARMILQDLGVSDDAERVYRMLLVEPAADVRTLAARLTLTDASVAEALRELVELRLATPDPGPRAGVAARNPAVAVDEL